MVANILVVDDSKMHVKAVSLILLQEGHHVFVSYDGIGIIELIKENAIDIILLDVVLPIQGGFELLEILQDDEDVRDVPVIMVTALTKPIHVKRALDMGALDYIKKPFEPIEVIARVHSALRLKRKQDLIQMYAETDGLTKLYNRAFIDKSLKNMIINSKRNEKGLAFAMIDCDKFKNINDEFGHIAGDEVLIEVANALSKSVKSKDIVGRFGGEEFCVILTDTTTEESLFICERIRMNVQKMQLNFEGAEIRITISVGITHIKAGQETNCIEVINNADKALYVAKKNGRNRVEVLAY